MSVEIQYITISVKDLDQSISFYKDILEFELFRRVSFPEGFRDHAGPVKGIAHMKAPNSSTMVELIQNEGMPPGMYSVGTDVDNLENLIRQLNEKGIELTTAIQETKLGPMVFIKDPDGVNIALIEHRK